VGKIVEIAVYLLGIIREMTAAQKAQANATIKTKRHLAAKSRANSETDSGLEILSVDG
jgi:hypothetical protein